MIKLRSEATLKLDETSTTGVAIEVEAENSKEASDALRDIMEEMRKGVPGDGDPQDKLDRILSVLNDHEVAHLGLEGTLLKVRDIAKGDD